MATPRIADPDLIEQRLLELAYTSDVKITAPALAYFAPTSIEHAQAVLDKLTSEDRLQMEVEEDGTIVYHVPARTRLAPLALTPAVTPRSLVRVDRHANTVLAVVLAALVPGAGHLYAGKFGAAVFWFFAVSIGYLLFFPGVILHIISVISAANATIPPHYQLTA